MSKRVGCTPTYFIFEFSYTYSSSASLHVNPYSLTLISIDGHLHSPLICLVDVRLSLPFVFSTTTIFYSTYSAMSMAHAHVLHESWKGLRTPKVGNNCLACHRGCAWFEYFVWRWSIARLYDFVGISFLWPCYFEIIALLVWLKYYCFYVNIKLLIWILWIWLFCHNREDYIDQYVR